MVQRRICIEFNKETKQGLRPLFINTLENKFRKKLNADFKTNLKDDE